MYPVFKVGYILARCPVLLDHFRELFDKLTIDLHDIDTHANEECIILHDKYVDDPDDDTIRKIEYNDKDLPKDELALLHTLRSQRDMPISW